MSETPLRSNFLGRLVDEAFGVEPALQPRRRSLFEPVPAASFGQEPPVDAPFVVQSVEAAADPVVSVGSASTREPREAVSEATPVAAQHDVAASRGIAPRSSLRIDPDTGPPTRRIEPGALAPSPVPAALTPDIAPRAALPHASPPAEAELPTMRRGSDVAAPITGSIRASRFEPHSGQSRRSHGLDHVRERAAPGRETHHPDIRTAAELLARPIAQDIVSQGSARTDRATAAPVAHDAPSPNPPVVNVTIGRIEVRAVQAPARSAERRGTKPLSLDDYLKRRTGQ